jgi:hypothetical protein
MNEVYWKVIVVISATIGVCLVVRFFRSNSSNTSVENYHYDKFLERYRSMDDGELDEVLARQLCDKFADSDSVEAIRQVMSERSRGNTPPDKFKSWQVPLVTENNKHHSQASEKKSWVDHFPPLEDEVNRSKTDRDDSCNDHGIASGFFSFRKMVSRFLIQFIYVIGMIVITLSGLSYCKMALESNNDRLADTHFGLGLLILIGGNLVWRVISELLIVIFNIHNILASIEKKMG